MTSFHRGDLAALLAASLLAFLLLLTLGGRSALASPDSQHFRLDQVPIHCAGVSDCPSSPGLTSVCSNNVCRYSCVSVSDCPQIPIFDVSEDTVICQSGLCTPKLVVFRDSQQEWIYPANVAPPTINYVAPNRQQIGGLCYYHAPMQSFQTKYAYEMDLQGWYSYGTNELDRSFLMSPVPFYQCAGQFGDVWEFLDVAGLVDHWLDPYGSTGVGFPPQPFPKETYQPDTCGYLARYAGFGPPWPAQTHPLQQQTPTVLTFRSNGWSDNFGVGTIDDIAPYVRDHGPVVCSVPHHVISVIGYDLRRLYGSPPVICYQDSDWSWDGEPRAWCASAQDFIDHKGGMCSSIYHIESVVAPIAYHSDDWPFIQWKIRAAWDINADGIPDDTSLDSDADRSFNAFDCSPRNPYQLIDIDLDGHCEPRLTAFQEETCLKWCETLELLGTIFNQPYGGGQGCEDKCRDWDRCITTGIKNVDDNQCDWRCLSTRGRDLNGDDHIDPWEICSPPPNAHVGDCCNYMETDLLENLCLPFYANVSNVDSDETNPGTTDNDRIADVCETAVSSRPTLSHDSHGHLTWELTPGGTVLIPTGFCSESRVKIELGLFGGSEWLVSGGVRYEIDWTFPRLRVSDVGVCGCVGDWATCVSGPVPSCTETDERIGTRDVWENIVALECADYGVGGLGSQGTLCEGKVAVHWRDEDCSDGLCNIHELYWSWGYHQPLHAGETVKIRVGVRESGQPYTSNKLYTSSAPITLPTSPMTCEGISSTMGSPASLRHWQLVVPHEPPLLPLGGHLGALAVGQDYASGEVFVFELDKRLRGPLNPVRLDYASADTPRVEPGGFVSVAGRVKSQLLGFAGTGTQALFVLGRREVPCPDCEDPSETTSQSDLWVAGLDEGLRTLALADDVFGPSNEQPPTMARPQAVYDRTMSRVVVAGGGESGSFAVWAYTPHIGQWHEIATGLPADLEGVAMVSDPVRHRLYLVGGRTGRVETPRMAIIDLVTGSATEVAPPPAALARSNHALAIDPFHRYLYVFGGKHGTRVLGDLWQYDMRAREWTQVDDGTDPTGPGAREQAQMLFERRYGRLWIAGGRDDAGFKAPTNWGFFTAMNLWQERPIGPEQGAGANALSGLFSPDSPVMWEVAIDEAVPYPGQVTRVGLTTGDPCVGLRVWDSAGVAVGESRHCSTGERVVTFLGQPGERYVVELLALEGFDLGIPTEYEVQVAQAALVSVGTHSVGPAWSRPRDLTVVPSPSGPVALALSPFALRSLDVQAPESPQSLDTLLLPGGVGTSVSLQSRDLAVVSLVGPGAADLQLVDVGDASHLALQDPIDLPGLAGRMAAVWRGGRVYTARAGKVEVVDLTAQAGPQHLGSVHVGGLITCLAVHGDRLYVCTVAKKLKVYELDRLQGETFVQQIKLDKIGQAVRVHGTTVHVGELSMWRYLVCRLGGSCNTGGQVEVLRPDTADALSIVGTYPMGVDALPYLELTGAGALRITDGGLDLYRVEALP